MKGLIKKLFGDGGGEDISYEKAKELAGHEDEGVRVELAERPDVRPEILYFLAEDSSPNVRRAIAENNRTPHHADLILSKDKDTGVRESLAEKIVRLAPELSADDQDKVKRMAYDTLETLARDELTWVRQILAESLKDVAEAPPQVIRRLAFDTELVVAGPILEHSPVLTDQDLIDIIENGSATGRLGSISKRSKVSEQVSDTIAATGDEDAVALLLANPSAQIREETLNSIVDEAREVVSWHAPLVSRPQISGYAAKRLAGFVAANLIRVLSIRSDLEPEVLEEVKKAVTARIESGEEGLKEAIATEDTQTPLELAMEKVGKLKKKGELTEAAVKKMLGGSGREMAIAALAAMAEIPAPAVQKSAQTKNVKGIVSICWKAGLTAKTAEQVQIELEIPDGEVMRGKEGNYAMSEADMEWQFEFAADMV